MKSGAKEFPVIAEQSKSPEAKQQEHEAEMTKLEEECFAQIKTLASSPRDLIVYLTRTPKLEKMFNNLAKQYNNTPNYFYKPKDKPSAIAASGVMVIPSLEIILPLLPLLGMAGLTKESLRRMFLFQVGLLRTSPGELITYVAAPAQTELLANKLAASPIIPTVVPKDPFAEEKHAAAFQKFIFDKKCFANIGMLQNAPEKLHAYLTEDLEIRQIFNTLAPLYGKDFGRYFYIPKGKDPAIPGAESMVAPNLESACIHLATMPDMYSHDAILNTFLLQIGLLRESPQELAQYLKEPLQQLILQNCMRQANPGFFATTVKSKYEQAEARAKAAETAALAAEHKAARAAAVAVKARNEAKHAAAFAAVVKKEAEREGVLQPVPRPGPA